ncbi:MAG TPA: PAS domain S-box protein [Methanospirillum sp.]|uniref:PAS domain S-box protein n=1 Tax=Methanospirillum sp. TaxID=45200 RepID=UPI002CB55E8F|nr:PAS domain S-box protein [Methanospirillum sp.]HWQ63762.1 PAS domain S-box protein [Methanospirillum sp.]
MALTSILTIGDPQQFSSITRLFSENGAKVDIYSVTDIKESFKKLQTTHIDVIISEFNLGPQNGIDFITRLKKQIQSSPISIFIGDQGPAIAKEALKAGIDYYFQKNGDPEFEKVLLNTFIRQVVKWKQAEEAHQYAETNFHTIVEATEDSIYMVDRHYRYLYINTPHLKRLGISGEEYESKMYRDLHSEDENKRFINSMSQVLTHSNFYLEEYEKEGRFYYRKFIPIKYQSSSQVLAVTVVSTDITDRVRLEDEVARSASLTTATLESTSDGIFVVDRAGKVINYNQKFLDMWYIPETVIEEKDEEVILAYLEDQLEDRNSFIERINWLKNNPDKDAFDVLEFRDGRIFERLTLPQRIGGTTVGRVWSFRDVTQQRSTLSALQITQANYRSVVESTGDSIYMVDLDSCYIFMNTYHRKKLGDLADKYLEQRMRVMLPPGEDKRFDEAIKRVSTSKKMFMDEIHWIGRDYIRRFSPVKDDDDGEVRAITVVLTDISERKAAEQEIRNSEERLKILFDHAPEAYFLTDIKGTFVDSNRAVTELTGFKKEDLHGRNIFTMGLIASMHITKTAVLFARNALGKSTGPEEMTIHRKDGSTLYAEVVTYPIKIQDQSLVMTIARDITQRREAEVALKEREEQYRLLVNNANEIVLVLRGGTIIFSNPKASSVIKKTREELAGHELGSLVHADDTEVVQNLVAEAAKSGAIHAGNVIRMYDNAGDIRWLEVGMVGVTWTEGPALLFLGNDVTDRKIAQDALVQSNKKLNLLSSITRHDVLNQITILLAYLDLLRKKNTDQNLVPFIDKQTEATQAIRSQIVFTKEYQDVGVKAPQWQNVGEKIRTAKELRKCEFIGWDEGLERLEIFADPLLEKVFSNLISNSLMHGEHVDNIFFSTVQKDSGITLVYEDNGVGIPSNEKKKIFEHGYGKNTGFGLFLSREILAITGLMITENGNPGSGARFEIQIPANAYKHI